jgi:arginase family enzyme
MTEEKHMPVPVILMNLTGVYDREDFWKQDGSLVELSDISGTRGYCSDEAAAEIRRRIADCPAEGLHYLDSGNYHYLTGFWTEKIREPFDLLVLDHHTDMQRPAFGDILSCGSWILNSIQSNEYLRRVFLVGADPGLEASIDPECEGVYQMLTVKEALADSRWLETERGSRDSVLYISVDKDVLAPSILETDWDQGTMTMEELTAVLTLAGQQRRVRGADVCGEPDPGNASDSLIQASDSVNRKIMEWWFQQSGA